MKDIAVIEGHMVTIPSKHNKLILEDHARVSVTRSRPFALYMMDLGVTLAAQHRRAFRVPHGPTHCFSLAHCLVICVKLAVIMVLNQEGSLHVVARRRIQTDLTLILQTLSLL